MLASFPGHASIATVIVMSDCVIPYSQQPVASMEEGVEPFESLSAQMPTRRSVGAGPLP